MKLKTDTSYDALIIGSGFGGSMTAKALVDAGMRVLMLERGDWVTRSPENWGLYGSVDLTPHYAMDSPLRVLAGGNKDVMGSYHCVGGPSVFYGGVSFRFREGDFEPGSEIVGDSGAAWPYRYSDLEPFYSEAERLLNISGEAGTDPTEPPRSAPFPQDLPPLADISQKIRHAAEALQLHPFHLPLAINYHRPERAQCIHCTTCDTFACAIGAKNDLATVLLPDLIARGMALQANTVAVRLNAREKAITAVDCIDKHSGEKFTVKARYVILSAGAMGSPHLLLASGLPELNPGGHNVGRYLMRHVNAIIFGIFPGVADKEQRFHKQLAIMDYYFGHPSITAPAGKLGSLQQMPTPPAGLVQKELPGPLGKLLSPGVKLLTGLLAIAEDQPQYRNHIALDPHQKDRYGLPQPLVTHHYSERDLAALNSLARQGKKVLRKAGAILHYVHHIRTFSHAVGTVRMGSDPKTSALDEFCRFRGIDNLFVVDGSFMPSAAAVNPSLTISANALRVGKYIVDG